MGSGRATGRIGLVSTGVRLSGGTDWRGVSGRSGRAGKGYGLVMGPGGATRGIFGRGPGSGCG